LQHHGVDKKNVAFRQQILHYFSLRAQYILQLQIIKQTMSYFTFLFIVEAARQHMKIHVSINTKLGQMYHFMTFLRGSQ